MSVQTAAEAEAPAAPASEMKTVTTRPASVITSRLVALPEELLSNISVRLGSDDVFALRLTCRDIEAKTFHEFATEYFSAKCFIFTTESLKVLSHIANHYKLRNYLAEVYFVPAQMDKPKMHCEHGQLFRSTVRQREAMALYAADQKQLHASGDDSHMIVEAFSKLPSLRILGLVDALSALPEGAECRGMQKIRRTTGTRPPLTGISFVSQTRVNFAWLSHVWTTIFHALATSGVSTVTRLETDLTCGLSPLTDLKLKKTFLPQVLPVLNNLEELAIQIRTQSFRLNKPDGDEDGHRARQALKILASAVPNMNSLKLSFDMDLRALSGEFFKTFMGKVNTGSLTYFFLESISIDVKTLASVLCKLRSVHTVSFHVVDIAHGGSWIPILKAVAQLPKLDHLHLLYLTEANSRVYFLEQLSLDEGDWAATANNFGQAHNSDNDDRWTDDEASDSDEELPQLIPDGVVADAIPQLVPNGVVAGEPAVAQPVAATKPRCKFDGGEDYKAPGCQSRSERGYYVCLQGQEAIQREIPNLIQKHNIGESRMDDDINNVFFNTVLGGAQLGGAAGVFPGIPVDGMGMAGHPPPPPPPAGAANTNAGGNPQANLPASINIGGNPLVNLQAMFGPPTQIGGNAENGFATYAFPVPTGNGANANVDPFADLAFPPQQAAQTPQTHQTTYPFADPFADLVLPPQQAPQTENAHQSQQTSQSLQACHVQADVLDIPVTHSSFSGWEPTTEGASDGRMMEEDLD